MPARGEARDLAEHAHLVAEIEVGGGLVHHQDARLLRERAGDQGELPLAAAECGVGPVGEVADAERRRAALARSRGRARDGDANSPRCAVRPISTTSRTVNGKSPACACGT